MNARELCAVFAGGVAGALARAGVGEAWPPHAGHWPWATFAVNVAGAALLGWVVAGRSHHRLLGTGFCGALTTFSTFSFETLRLLEEGSPLEAAGNVVVSLVAGMAAATAGYYVVSWLA